MKEHLATEEHPFHYIDSGLPGVFLIGIRFFTCECGRTLAHIPAIEQLHQLIARDLVRKPEALTGDEIRFLRKRLGKKSVDFAKEIGVEPETMSRIENGHQTAGESTDKLIRLRYAISSADSALLEELAREADALLQHWVASAAPKKIVKSIKGNVWSEAKAA